jgi:hypothetical protein
MPALVSALADVGRAAPAASNRASFCVLTDVGRRGSTCRRSGLAARAAASATALSTLAGAAVGTVNAKPRNGLIAFMRPGTVGEYDIRVVQPDSTGLRSRPQTV